MAKVYCEYCGREYNNVRDLTANKCPNHPNGFCKGPHKLYEGSEKSKYTCKYCGREYRNLRDLTANKCPQHPDGFCKGSHSPAL